MNGPAVARSGRARRTGRREMASISAVYYPGGDGEGYPQAMGGVMRSNGRLVDHRYLESWSEPGVGVCGCLLGTTVFTATGFVEGGEI